MDALSECDQFMKVAGSSASSPWLIMYRKEMFTPWYDPANDEVATSLIFAQICKGIKREEYLMRSVSDLDLSTWLTLDEVRRPRTLY